MAWFDGLLLEVIRYVVLALSAWALVDALIRCGEADSAGGDQFPWVPLVLASDWAEGHPDMTEPRPGPELLKTFLGHLKDATDQRYGMEPRGPS